MSAHDIEMEVDENDATVNCTGNSITSQERKLRYKALLDDVASLDNDENNDLATIDRACQLVEVTESLNQTKNADSCVKHPWEGFLDSKVLLATSNMVIRCTEAVSGNTNMYDADALAEHIKNNPSFWDFTLPKTVPPLAYLFGTFDFEEVAIERKNRNTQRKSQLPVGEASAPENLTQLENKEECSDMVGKVYTLLCSRYREGGQKPIGYFNCVLDPGDFGKTIENIYYISFLVRDGLVTIAVDEDGLPYIKPIPMKKRDKDKTKESNENNQFIVSIDVKKMEGSCKGIRYKKSIHDSDCLRSYSFL